MIIGANKKIGIKTSCQLFLFSQLYNFLLKTYLIGKTEKKKRDLKSD